jgi:Patched family
VVVSIGLLVDFLIHVLLRYYECPPGMSRDARVKETLETIGASVAIGGATTFLAVVPLAASSLEIFMTVFSAFFAMVALGCTHGLILLPVVLSLVGPTTNVRHDRKEKRDSDGPSLDKDISACNSGELTITQDSSFGLGDSGDMDLALNLATLRVIEEAEASDQSENIEETCSENGANANSLSETESFYSL